MAAGAAVFVTALLLEDQHLVALALFQDLGAHLGAIDEGRANLGLITTDHQHLIEVDGLADLAFELFDLDHVTGGHAILLATCLDYRVHRLIRIRWKRRKKLRPNDHVIRGSPDISLGMPVVKPDRLAGRAVLADQNGQKLKAKLPRR